MFSQRITRRNFLRASGIGAAALFGSSFDAFGGFRVKAQSQPFAPDAEVSITAVEKTVQIYAGAPTRVWSYEGRLLSGSGVTVQAVPGSYLGPVLRVKSGTKLRIQFNNELAEKTVLHPHGLRVPEDCDGQPMQSIDPGQTKVYEFQVIDRAGPYWFHPHPMMRTAEQVVMGLAGLFYVWDPEEEIAVPGASTGANDIPLILQDRLFDANNQFLYQPNMMWGYLGDRVLVNGQAGPSLAPEPRAYRLRILNGSNARTYKLAWSNGMPLTVIGSDGGLLPAPLTRDYVMLMPGERVDVWADFSKLAGKRVILRSLAFDPGGMGMGMMGGMGGGGMMGGMGMMGGSSLANGAAIDILKVNVGRKATAKPELGPFPAFPVRYDAGNVPNYAAPRPFTLSMGHMMSWTINGRIYNMNDMTEVAADEIFTRDEVLALEWINASPIPHPMHIHNVQFQVLERAAEWTPPGYASVNQGFVDTGWKDTVLVWPGERVKIALSFGPHTGMYMYHCHILEHEDMTMMRNLMVMEPGM